MERLTTTNKSVNREMVCRNEDCGVTEEHCPHLLEDECECLRKVIDKLADYEDAEEQGLLLRLPCPIGTKVYALVNECEEMYEPDSWYTTISEESFDLYMIHVFGKEVFLTREEAVAELQGVLLRLEERARGEEPEQQEPQDQGEQLPEQMSIEDMEGVAENEQTAEKEGV